MYRQIDVYWVGKTYSTWVDAFRQRLFQHPNIDKTIRTHKNKASKHSFIPVDISRVPTYYENVPKCKYTSNTARQLNGKERENTYIRQFMLTVSVFLFNIYFIIWVQYTAADFAHFINPTRVLIVSFVAMYAASVAFLLPLLLHFAITFAPPQFGKFS